MSFVATNVFISAAVRSIVLALLAVSIARALAPSARRALLRYRGAVWALLLVPVLSPAVLVGYAYTDFGALLTTPLWQRELTYDGLLLLRVLPVALFVICGTHASVSRAATHCDRLLTPRRRLPARAWAALQRNVRAHGPVGASAACLCCLLVFAEFDLASFFSVPHWTVAVFDLQAGGASLSATVLASSYPFLLCMAVCMLAVIAASRLQIDERGALDADPPGGIRGVALCVYLATAWLALLWQQAQRLEREIVASVTVAAATVAVLLPLARAVVPRRLERRLSLATILACVPGAFGGLLLALLLLRAFQLPGLRGIYDTPLPLLVGLVAVFLPYAILMRVVMLRAARRSGDHAVSLLSAGAASQRSSARRLQRRRSHAAFWAAGLLFVWAYSELTLSSILAPSGMTPAVPRMYNFMHYGRSEVLSAMVVLTLVVPIVLLAFARVALRTWEARHG